MEMVRYPSLLKLALINLCLIQFLISLPLFEISYVCLVRSFFVADTLNFDRINCLNPTIPISNARYKILSRLLVTLDDTWYIEFLIALSPDNEQVDFRFQNHPT
jgi:hypothetical protein